MLFLKSNEILPIFDKRVLIQNQNALNKIQSMEDLTNQKVQKSNHSADFHLHQTNTNSEKTNIISLGGKIHYNNDNNKESGGNMCDESNMEMPNSKIT